MTKPKYTRKANDFFAKYKHPKWQAKRLKVMEVAGFKCTHCGDKDSTLNVHHISYFKGRDPWEYDDDELVCLCEGCHESMHDMEDRLKEALHAYKVIHYQCNYSIEWLIGYLTAASNDGPFRIQAHDDDLWLDGFLSYFRCDSKEYNMDTRGPGEFILLRELIDADDGFIDYEWIKFYRSDVISDNMIAYIKKYGVYWRDGFPSWFEEKISGMISSCSHQGK